MQLQFPSSKSQSVSTFEERDPRPIAWEILKSIDGILVELLRGKSLFSIQALGVLISDGLAELLNRSASLTLSKFAGM